MEEKEKKNSKKKMWQIAFTINFTVVAMAIIVALAMMDSDDSESTKSKTVATSTNAVETENEVTKQNYIANSEKKTNEEKSQQTATKDNTTTATENTVKNSTNDSEKTYTTAQEIADGTTSYEKDTTTKNNTNEERNFNRGNVIIGKTLSANDVYNGKPNTETAYIAYLATAGFDDVFPNWVLHSATIQEADGCGRFWVYVKYLKNKSDTTYSGEHEIVAVGNSGNSRKYRTIGSIDQQKRDADWGSPLDF